MAIKEYDFKMEKMQKIVTLSAAGRNKRIKLVHPPPPTHPPPIVT
jgi:hypothetical protein